MLKKFWNDEAGVIVSAEIVLVATILVLGLIVLAFSTLAERWSEAR